MNTPLETILSQRGEAVSEQTEEQVTQQPAEATEADVPQQEQPNGDGPESSQGQRMVPHEALHAEKQKVKRYTEEVSEFRKQLAESNAAWERRVASILEAQRPKQEAPQAPDWFENPTEAMRHQMAQQVSPAFEQVGATLQGFAKELAITRFSEEQVTEAEQAFLTAMNSGKLDQADYQRVVSSPNRFAAAVQWHKRQTAQAEIGDDPAAFKAKLETEIREKVLAEINGGNAQQEQPARVMPSNFATARNVGNRSGPAWSGPAPIDNIFAVKRGQTR